MTGAASPPKAISAPLRSQALAPAAFQGIFTG